MAIYRLEADIIRRSTGRSATACAAYRAASKIEDTRTGQVFDYTRKRGVLHNEIITPDDTPAWMQDRTQLWNAVEKAEKRKDAQLAREILLSLPHELTPAQRIEMVREYVRAEFVGQGMIADIAFHAPHRQGDERNYHAHVLLTMRSLTGEAFGNKVRAWNDKDQLEQWREHWAETVNRHLEKYGHDARVDHRSLSDQGIDREPEPKQGPVATEMERAGATSHAGDDRRAAQQRNEERKSVAAAMVAALAEIQHLQAEWEHERQEAMTPIDEKKLAEQVEAQKAGYEMIARQERAIKEFREQQQRAAEDAKKQQEEREAAEKARAEAGEIASAQSRYAQALGNHYDVRDPYGSLTRAAIAEYGAFHRDQEKLRFQIGQESDPEKRQLLEFRKEIEACDYMAITHQRLAGISDAIGAHDERDPHNIHYGRSRQGIIDEAKADIYLAQAKDLRQQRDELIAARMERASQLSLQEVVTEPERSNVALEAGQQPPAEPSPAPRGDAAAKKADRIEPEGTTEPPKAAEPDPERRDPGIDDGHSRRVDQTQTAKREVTDKDAELSDAQRAALAKLEAGFQKFDSDEKSRSLERGNDGGGRSY